MTKTVEVTQSKQVKSEQVVEKKKVKIETTLSALKKGADKERGPLNKMYV